jgi:hypothetical protein
MILLFFVIPKIYLSFIKKILMEKKVSIVLRLDAKIHRAAKKMAKEKFQSLNGLINNALQDCLKKDEKNTSKSLV